MTKATKAKARYRSGPPHRRCSLCTMFRPPHGCTAVLGPVSPSGLCDYFKRKSHPSTNAQEKPRNWYGNKD